MAVIGDSLYWIFVPVRLHEDVSGLHAGDVFDDFVFGFVGEQLDAGAFCRVSSMNPSWPSWNSSPMSKPLTVYCRAPSVCPIPGVSRNSRIMSPPYAETRTRRFLSWANVMFRQKRLSCSSIGCRCFLSIYVDVFSITSKRELRGGGESSECRDMLNAST